jgi:phosphatidylglycerol:prolipoprotein diacylglycerol transferase
MRPTLLDFNLFGIPFDFHAYVVMISIAFLVCTLMAVRENYRQPNPYPITPIVGIWIFLGAFVGARAYWIAQYGAAYEAAHGDPVHWYHAFYIWQSGLVFYGGLLGGLVAAIAYLLYCRVPLLPMGDIAMPWVPLGIAITRLGCFLNGCCWGTPTDVPWAVAFPRGCPAYDHHVEVGLVPGSASHSLPVHPTQLYNLFGQLAVFLILLWMYRRFRAGGTDRHVGLVLFTFPLLYGMVRFTTEIFRGDSGRPILDLTVSQVVSLLMIAVALVGYAILWHVRWRMQDAPAGDAPVGDTEQETPLHS